MHPHENAAIAVRNLIAAAQRPSAVSASQVIETMAEHGAESPVRLQAELGGVYESYLRACLADQILTDEEAGEMSHLRAILSLSDNTLEQIHTRVGKEFYGAAVDGVMRDGVATDLEHRFLNELREKLQLAPAIAKAIYTKKFEALYRARLDTSLSDQMLSPEEDRELSALAHSLGVNVSHSDAGQLDRFRLLWKIQNEGLPQIAAPINLQRGEVCHLSTSGALMEIVKRTERIGYSGPAVSFRIMKGVYWRAASFKPHVMTKTAMVKTDAGPLCITSKRLVFVGTVKSLSIRLASILSTEPYSDGISISRGTQKPTMFAEIEDGQLFHHVLTAAMIQAGE